MRLKKGKEGEKKRKKYDDCTNGCPVSGTSACSVCVGKKRKMVDIVVLGLAEKENYRHGRRHLDFW